MGIEVASGFDMKSPLPLDSRTVVADQTARDAIPSGVRYEGLLVYVIADGVMYQLQGGITNSDWAEAGGGGGATMPVVDLFAGTGAQVNFTLSQDPGHEDNTMVFITGAYQNKDTYSVSGTTLTFSTAPPDTTAIQVLIGGVNAVNVPIDNSVTPAKMAAYNKVVSATCTSFSTTSGAPVDVTNLTLSFTASGLRPVFIGLENDPVAGIGTLQATDPGSAAGMIIEIHRGVTRIKRDILAFAQAGGTATEIYWPVSSIWMIDTPAAGTHTYKVKLSNGYGTDTGRMNYAKLVAYEL